MARTRRVRTLAHCAIMVLTVAAGARAGTPVPAELIDALKAADFRAREDATNQLIGRADFKIQDLDGALKTPGLTPEQRARLLRAVRSRFFDGQRAALGVAFDQFNNFGGNVIQRTIRNFPSGAVLRPGDQLIEIDGWTLPGGGGRFGSSSSARPYIICHDPGDVVPIKINRDGVEMTLDVPLGRFSDLQGEPLTEMELEEAWRVRAARYHPSADEMIRPDTLPSRGAFSADQRAMNIAIDPTFWSAVGGGTARGGRIDPAGELEASRAAIDRDQNGVRFNGGIGGAGVRIVGGEVFINGRRVQNGEVVDGMRVQIDPGGGVRIEGGGVRIGGGAPAAGGAGLVGGVPQVRAMLEQQIADAKERIALVDRMLEAEELDEAQRTLLKTRRAAYEQELQSLQQMLRLQDDFRVPVRP